MSDTEQTFKIVGHDLSDGYHTFGELYAHRIELFLALCRALVIHDTGHHVWRAIYHADGTTYDGWFILGIDMEPDTQITYHLPIDRWETANFAETYERAPEWDGHTSEDVIERLRNLA